VTKLGMQQTSHEVLVVGDKKELSRHNSHFISTKEKKSSNFILGGNQPQIGWCWRFSNGAEPSVSSVLIVALLLYI